MLMYLGGMVFPTCGPPRTTHLPQGGGGFGESRSDQGCRRYAPGNTSISDDVLSGRPSGVEERTENRLPLASHS
jgi:hypothetical protein